MHFCVLATRFQGGFSVPRKYGLNWFMPAFADSHVGASWGTTGDDGTNVWPCFLTKKSMNCWRISLAVGIRDSVKHPRTTRIDTSLGKRKSWRKGRAGQGRLAIRVIREIRGC